MGTGGGGGVHSPRVKRGRGVTLTTHLRLVPWLRVPERLFGAQWDSYTSSFTWDKKIHVYWLAKRGL